MTTHSGPCVAVLLATCNGMRWLPEQVATILSQTGVTVRLIVSDDASSDGSREWIGALAIGDSRVCVLPDTERFGSAGANFYRLLTDADLTGVDYVAFADQDDLWNHDKLARAVALLNVQGAEGVSSNVTAFWPNGRTALIDKAQPQRRFDYLFEAAGPGCSYLLKCDFALQIRRVLREVPEARQVVHHDWLCYALCRGTGRRWAIDPMSTLRYRQHDGNEVGANWGITAARRRARKVASGWYRREVLKICRVLRAIGDNHQDFARLGELLESNTWFGRLPLAMKVSQFRRRQRDRWALRAMLLTGLF